MVVALLLIILHFIAKFLWTFSCIASQLCFSPMEKLDYIYVNNIPYIFHCFTLSTASCLTALYPCLKSQSFITSAYPQSQFPLRPVFEVRSTRDPNTVHIVCQVKCKQCESKSPLRRAIMPERWLIWWFVPPSGWRIWMPTNLKQFTPSAAAHPQWGSCWRLISSLF